jgi:hypothetical protein
LASLAIEEANRKPCPRFTFERNLLRCNEAMYSVSQIWDFDYERFPQADTEFKAVNAG